MEFNFSGYATKNNILCSDGRTILQDAFKHQDGETVPLVWEHGKNSPTNVLGHARLENREDGVYAYCSFNDTPHAQHAKSSVEHGDIKRLSIAAGRLKEQAKKVMHGMISEVSLVLNGANAGAVIDNVVLTHSDGYSEMLEDEAIIHTGLEFELNHADAEEESEDGETVQEVIDTLNEKQRDVVYALIGQALGHSDEESAEDLQHKDEEGNPTVHNIFENSAPETSPKMRLTAAQVSEIIHSADGSNGKLKDAVLQHAVTYGIENIEILFPDAQAIRNTPDFVKRQTEWVSSFYNGTRKVPFSRIKSLSADITFDTARAKGYIKATMKKEEFFKVSSRETLPKTIYKKQKLDRDDIVDITDFDVVAWIKAEMRLMLDEEIARAGLIGDGREIDDPDKIDETKIRPIATDDEFYTHPVNVAANTGPEDQIESIIRARKHFKGTGTPNFYTTEDVLTDMLLIKDKVGRRIYRTVQDLAAELRVASIVPVEVMEGFEKDGRGLVGVMVNPTDYTYGATRGGEINFFDDFDIDFNQEKYLYETRLSGALTLPKSAVAIWRAAGTSVTPTAPTFNSGTNVITIPTVTGVVYQIDGVTKTGTVTITEDTLVDADPATGYYFPAGTDSDWVFTYTAG